MLANSHALGLAVLLCTACSGGSASDPLVPSAQIGRANAMSVTEVTLNAVFGLAEATALVVELLPTFANGVAEGPQGGQVLRTFADRDGDGVVSTGDACTFAFVAYRDAGQVVNGAVRIDVLELQGPLIEVQSSILDARLQCLGLTVARGVGTETLVGDVLVRREQRPTVRLLAIDVDSPFDVGARTLQPGARVERNDFPLIYARAWSAAGAVEAFGATGLLEFDTEVPFVGSLFQPFPWSGTLDVRGLNSRITIKAVDYTADLTVELDVDGDGEVDETIETSWSEL